MSAQLAAADLAAADLADDELAAAGALPELPAEPFRGGYAETAAETAARGRYRNGNRGGNRTASAVLREIVLRYPLAAYTQIGSATAEADRAVAYEERMLDLRLDRDQVLPAAA